MTFQSVICGDEAHSGQNLGDVEIGSMECSENHFEFAKISENDVLVKMDTRPLADEPPFVHYQLEYKQFGELIPI